MRKIRKLLIAVIVACLAIPGMATVAHAASAEFRFSDPSTSVGAEVDITAKVSSAVDLNTVQATLNYDSSKLRFISGDDATGSDGTINLSRSDSSAGTTMEFNLKFQALEEGETSIEVEKVDGIDDTGVALQFETGSSAVSIAEGDPSLIQEEPAADNSTSGVEVKVGKAKYTVTDDFSDTIIPTGFVRDTLKFEGEDHQIVKQESSGALAMYLTPVKEGESDFFLYDSDTGSFSPLEVVEIAKNRYIMPLADDGSITLSDVYQKTTLTLNGKEFDTWQDTKNAEYYIIYAMNSDGEKTTYRYDTIDGTYQKYTPSESSASSVVAGSNGSGLWGKVLNFVENFLDIVVIIALALILILVLVLIVTSVKLYHRDLELDDLYDEYGIDMDEEEAELKAKKKEAKAGKKAAKKVQKEEAKKAPKKVQKEIADEDEFEGYNDDDFDDEDPWATENIAKAMKEEPAKKKMSETRRLAAQSLDESGPAIRKPVNNISIQDDDFEVFAPLDEEEFDNFEGYYGEDDDDDYDMFGESDYDDDDMFDETSDLLSNHPEKIRSHAEMDDTFKMDVIDLD